MSFEEFLRSHNIDPGKVDAAFYDELKNFKEALEKHLGIKITNSKLKEAIKTHNETRKLLRQL